MATLFTIGHSTRTLEELIEALRAHGVATLVDIRSFPMSRRLPHFNREALARALPAAGLRYVWKPGFGGRRKKIRDDSPNRALQSDAFRNYADYMLTEPFAAALSEVLDGAAASRTAIMCAERPFFRCHRMLVSDAAVARGHTVLHIDATAPPREHRLTRGARIVGGGRVIYDAPEGQGELFGGAP